MRWALLSVSDKRGIVDLARGLHDLGFGLLSTGGTWEALSQAGIKAQKIESLTGFPEILGGRVKTLHPKVFGGILARRDREEDLQTLEQHDIPRIDLVAVNLYPFEAAAEQGLPEGELLEFVDIGGVALLRAAAKNFPHVIVLCDPADYGPVLQTLREKGDLPYEARKALALKAFRETAYYDGVIEGVLRGSPLESPPEKGVLPYRKHSDLRYGENPHQRGWALETRPFGGFLRKIRQLHGKPLSYNNLLDAYAAWGLVQEFHDTACVIVKHMSPCGVALADSPEEAFEAAFQADPISAFGGIVALNREVSAPLAEALNRHFLEVVIAPAYAREALPILQKKKNRRILVAAPVTPPLEVRSLGGDLLAQEPDRMLVDPQKLRVVTRRAPNEREMKDLLFAFAVVKHVKSNAIVLARNRVTVGIGAGQMSRVGAVEIALRQAGEKAAGAVMASDAFFPFPDSIAMAASAGVSAVIQPGGSVRDAEVIAEANRHGLAMVFTEVRHFRH